MIKINISQTAINEFKDSVLANFKSDEIENINKILKQKLKDFKFNIDLEQLITLNYDKILDLNDFVATNKIEFKNDFSDLYKNKVTQKIRAKYVSNLDISTCPYCNRNYIVNFNKYGETTAQLDHFFNKSKYPHLAISIYNLIPSCYTCNQRKSSKDKKIYYPFKESFDDDVKFKIILQDANLKDNNSINLDCDITTNYEKAKNHIEVFNIKSLYNEHKDLAFELLQKSKIYNESYINELIKNYQGRIFGSKSELFRLITGSYTDTKDINKRPFNKLIKDISQQLKLF